MSGVAVGGTAGVAGAPSYRAVFEKLRTAPLAQLRQALQQQVTVHLQALQQIHPCPPNATPEQRQLHQQQLSYLQQEQMREQLTGAAGSTALFEAAQRSSDAEALELSVMLADEFKAALPTAQDRMGQTCLFYAAREGHAQLCRFLLSRGLDVNHRDSVGQTCIFYAAREGRASCLGVLLQGGGDPNILDVNKQTCLFYACRDNRLEAVRLLLQHGADATVKDTLRRTASHFAKSNGHLAVCALLRHAASAQGAAPLPSSQVGVLGLDASSGTSHAASQSPAPATGPMLYPPTNVSGTGNAQQRGASGFDQSATTCVSATALGAPASLNSSSSLGSACASSEDAGHAQQRQRRKYKLQFQPLPTEAPDVWVDCPFEKIEEFSRLFPSLNVWPPAVVSAAGAASANAGELSAAKCLARCEALMQPWQAAASQLLAALSKYEGAHIFDRPVDPKTAPGYYDVVTTPMSLSCVKAKLKKQVYGHPHAFLSDVQLIFDNCALYNQPGTWVHSIGKNMEKFFLNQVMVMRFRDYGLTFNKILSNLQQTAAANEQFRAAKTEGDRSSASNATTTTATHLQPSSDSSNGNCPAPSAASASSSAPMESASCVGESLQNPQSPPQPRVECSSDAARSETATAVGPQQQTTEQKLDASQSHGTNCVDAPEQPEAGSGVSGESQGGGGTTAPAAAATDSEAKTDKDPNAEA